MNQPFPFNIKSFGFCLNNAYSLAKVAKAVYMDFGDRGPGSLATKINSWGFDPSRSRFFDRTGTQALLVGDDEKLILAFRGTEPDRLEDWVADANIRMTASPAGDVHRGFHRALQYVWNDVEDAIEELRDQRQTLWVTGHSLGAALGTLAVASMKFRETPVVVNGLYTFGQPRVGCEKFADRFNAVFKGRAFRIVNNNDVVSRVPLSALGYSHVGNLRYFDINGNLNADTDLSWWDRFWDRLGGEIENYRNQRLFDGIDDHSMSAYLGLLKKAVAFTPGI